MADNPVMVAAGSPPAADNRVAVARVEIPVPAAAPDKRVEAQVVFAQVYTPIRAVTPGILMAVLGILSVALGILSVAPGILLVALGMLSATALDNLAVVTPDYQLTVALDYQLAAAPGNLPVTAPDCQLTVALDSLPAVASDNLPAVALDNLPVVALDCSPKAMLALALHAPPVRGEPSEQADPPAT